MTTSSAAGSPSMRASRSEPPVTPFCLTGADGEQLVALLEGGVKRRLARHPDLISRNAALEKVRELSHILRVHKGERIPGAKVRPKAEGDESLISDKFEIVAHIENGESSDTDAGQSFCKFCSHSTASVIISRMLASSDSSKRSGSSLRICSTTAKAKAMWPLSSRKTQLVPAASPCKARASARNRRMQRRRRRKGLLYMQRSK